MRIALVLALACSGKPPAPVTQPGRPLFDRLGGMDGLKAAMKDLVEDELARDSRLGARFTNVDGPQLEESLAVQLCELTGGPCHYAGRHIKEAHAGMQIDDTDFAAFVEDLRRSLAKQHVAEAEQRELAAVLGKLRDQIVE